MWMRITTNKLLNSCRNWTQIMVSHKEWSEIRVENCQAPVMRIRSRLNSSGLKTASETTTTMLSAPIWSSNSHRLKNRDCLIITHQIYWMSWAWKKWLLRSICSLKTCKIPKSLVMNLKSRTPLISAGTTHSTQMLVEKEEKVLTTLAVRRFLQIALLNQTS